MLFYGEQSTEHIPASNSLTKVLEPCLKFHFICSLYLAASTHVSKTRSALFLVSFEFYPHIPPEKEEVIALFRHIMSVLLGTQAPLIIVKLHCKALHLVPASSAPVVVCVDAIECLYSWATLSVHKISALNELAKRPPRLVHVASQAISE